MSCCNCQNNNCGCVSYDGSKIIYTGTNITGDFPVNRGMTFNQFVQQVALQNTGNPMSDELLEISELSLAQLNVIEQHLNDATSNDSSGIPFRVSVDNFPMQNPTIYPYTVHRGVSDSGEIWDMLIYHSGPPLIYYVNANGQISQTKPQGFKFSNGESTPPVENFEMEIKSEEGLFVIPMSAPPVLMRVELTNIGLTSISNYSGSINYDTSGLGWLNMTKNTDNQVSYDGSLYTNDINDFQMTEIPGQFFFNSNVSLNPGQKKVFFMNVVNHFGNSEDQGDISISIETVNGSTIPFTGYTVTYYIS